MIASDFEAVFEDQVSRCREVLVDKAKEYADDTDRLHNFQAAAALIGGTPEQALWGFATKHLVSISDMVYKDDYYSDDKWNEKIGDALNYLFLLRAQVIETDSKRSMTDVNEPLRIYGPTREGRNVHQDHPV